MGDGQLVERRSSAGLAVWPRAVRGQKKGEAAYNSLCVCHDISGDGGKSWTFYPLTAFILCVGPYDLRDAENVDGFAEFRLENSDSEQNLCFE